MAYVQKFVPINRECVFCHNKIKEIDYKDGQMLGKYLSSWAKIETRRRTGCCSLHQRQLALALKRARHLAILPYTVK